MGDLLCCYGAESSGRDLSVIKVRKWVDLDVLKIKSSRTHCVIV